MLLLLMPLVYVCCILIFCSIWDGFVRETSWNGVGIEEREDRGVGL